MEARDLEAQEIVPASRKLGRDEAQALAEAAGKLIVAKGKKVSEFKAGASISDEAIEAMLGPTGNLRAPTVRVGKTVVVGFNEESYASVLD